jgi:hypothetical protein
MRTSLAVLGVSLIGAVVTMATFKLQQIHSERSKLDAESREDKRVTIRRADDRNHDERRRLDDRVADFLSNTIDAYNAVKQVRRLLEAEIGPEADGSIRRDAYLSLLTELSDQQLIFERLRRRAGLIEGRIEDGKDIRVKLETVADKDVTGQGTGVGIEAGGNMITKTLTAHYKHIESYLNDIVEEFQKHLYLISTDIPFSLHNLEEGYLRNFIYRTPLFQNNVSHRINAIVTCLETHLLTSTTPLSKNPASP